MNKDVRKFIRWLKSNGLVVEQGRNAHYKIYDNSQLICTISASPSDVRWLKNVQQTLAANGFKKRYK